MKHLRSHEIYGSFPHNILLDLMEEPQYIYNQIVEVFTEIEPALPKKLDFESSASTNSAT